MDKKTYNEIVSILDNITKNELLHKHKIALNYYVYLHEIFFEEISSLLLTISAKEEKKREGGMS